MEEPSGTSRAAWTGLAVALALVALAATLPAITGWEVRSRSANAGGIAVPPLHGTWAPTWFGPGTLPAVLLALAGWRWATDLADRLSSTARTCAETGIDLAVRDQTPPPSEISEAS